MAITEYLKSRKNACKKLINELKDVYSYVSVLGVDTEGFNIRTDKYKTSITDSSSNERGFVIKVYDNSGYLEYSVDDINDDNYLESVNVLKNFSVSENVKRVKAKLISDEKMVKSFERIDEKPISIQYILETLDKYKEEALQKNEFIFNAIFIFEKFTTSKMFLTENKDLEQTYPWCSSRMAVVTRKEQVIKSARAGVGGKDSLEVLEKLSEKIDETANLAVELLSAEAIVPGYYDVITDPSITGLIAHEAFGHGVEMDMFVKNRAKSKDYFGKYVASPIVNMHDGANATYSVASYFFDDDGVLASDTEIIRNGILVNGMSDALSAMQLGSEPTGNGRREAFSHKAYTRMTNTFFTPGKDKLEDMIKSIDYGFYLVDTNNGMEDPKNWQIQCVCEYAREIKDGKFTGKLFSPVVISGYVLDLLNSITMISDEFVIDGQGFCGKGYKEWVRVSDGGPHLKAKVKLG